MLIVGDENIPYLREAFGPLGEVRALAGRAIAPSDVADADVLLVRSVTPVGEPLLGGARVQFVGSATAGVDHVDVEYLRGRGIEFASAAGSNAESVAQYVAAALVALRPTLGALAGRSIGVVGMGHCGSRVARIAEALGMRIVPCDPPLGRRTGDAALRPLGELSACDFVTFHVPLTRSGRDATEGLIGRDFLGAMAPTSVVINAARGGVVDEKELTEALDAGRIGRAVVDAWANEPDISLDLLDRVFIGTPHIAGYSLDGKIRGTEMIHQALCRHLGTEPDWNAGSVLPRTVVSIAHGETGGAAAEDEKSTEEFLADWIARAYPIGRDAAALRGLGDVAPAERSSYFDSLRKNYPVRREFGATRIELSAAATPKLLAAARGLGFDVSDPRADAVAVADAENEKEKEGDRSA